MIKDGKKKIDKNKSKKNHKNVLTQKNKNVRINITD